jgi:hypothetical protein
MNFSFAEEVSHQPEVIKRVVCFHCKSLHRSNVPVLKAIDGPCLGRASGDTRSPQSAPARERWRRADGERKRRAFEVPCGQGRPVVVERRAVVVEVGKLVL